MSEVVVTEAHKEEARYIVGRHFNPKAMWDLVIQVATAIAQAEQRGREEKNPRARKAKAIAVIPPSAETWNAYEAAYEATYQVKPVRNARVNTQLTNVVKCLGAVEAPQIASWYLKHRSFQYVNGGHSISLLLRDCEKLRTEWATGMRLHRRDADEIDRTSADSAMWNRIEQKHEARRTG